MKTRTNGSLKIWYCLFFSFLLQQTAIAQRYIFIPYNVENGLAQSQPLCFVQNTDDELFIGTLGGLSRFDGSNFINYNRADGLPHNLIYSLAVDSNQNVWIGTPNGISRFNGVSFKNYTIPITQQSVSQIVVDKSNIIWALSFPYLFRLKKDSFKHDINVDTVLAITTDKSGGIWAFRYKKGIFVWKGTSWHQEIDTKAQENLVIFKMYFGTFSGTLYCITSDGLKVVDNGKLTTPKWMTTFLKSSFIHAIFEDSKGNLWLAGNDGGVWFFGQNTWTHFDYNNGFSNETVNSFFEDNENNIWLATDGSGMYRFSGSSFTYYDRESGLSTPSIMSITEDNSRNLYFIGSNNELFRMSKGSLSKVYIPKIVPKINVLFTDKSNKIWLGTNNGIWTFNSGRFLEFPYSGNARPIGITHISETDSNIWISATNGLFRIKGKQLVRENVFSQVLTTQSLDSNRLIYGNIQGAFIYHIKEKKADSQPFIRDATVMAITSDNKNVYIGTDDRGIVILDKNSGSIKAINQTDGLSCNYIYSLLIDNSGNLWAGTGCGINEISFNNGKYKIFNFEQSNGLKGIESNANAVLQDDAGYIWFGTNRALFRYNPYINVKNNQVRNPKIIFQSVKLFSKAIPVNKYADSSLPFSNIPYNPYFPTKQNHITFTFRRVSLSSPEKIKYKYQLVGIDKEVTETNQNTVIYPNLPPGHYQFKVWASDPEGTWSPIPAVYPFTIIQPFYTTLIFKLGMLLLLMALFLGGVYIRTRQQRIRVFREEQLKEEEQNRVRKKTAEDFHDEIGNKLTRINLLATIAESKIVEPSIEVKDILNQIKANVTQLYKGSKDIIWSLQPQSDFLNEILWKIQQNTTEMLEGSAIKFEYEKIGTWDTNIKLPIDYSRNIIMIFKEAVNNMVKHANATQLQLTIEKDKNEILFQLKDNGKGFTSISDGNGLQNMSNRAQRIHGKIVLDSEINIGTTINLYVYL